MKTQVTSLATRIAAISLLGIASIPIATPSQAADFERINESISTQEQLVTALTTAEDTFSQVLIEPLTELAKLQVSANRFSDARESISMALQASRISHGLYDERQLPLLQLDIETTVALSNFSGAKEKLAHYTWLLTDHIALPVEDIAESVLWLKSAHEQASFAVSKEDRAWHVASATRLNEALVRLSAREGLQDSASHVQYLYGLTQSYYLEAKTILAGGSPSFHLRIPHASISNVEARSNSLRRLYNFGLHRLLEIQSIIAVSDKFGPEAESLVQLRIADWKALFGRSDELPQDYGVAIAGLRQAGVSEESLNQLLRQPVLLPRPTLSLSIAEEILTNQESSPVTAQAAATQLTLFEATADIAGATKEQDPHIWNKQSINDWHSVVAEISIDPHTRKTVRNSGYHTRSYVTPSTVMLVNSNGLDQETLSSVQERIGVLGFRPAFVNGQPIQSSILINYYIREFTAQKLVKSLSLR